MQSGTTDWFPICLVVFVQLVKLFTVLLSYSILAKGFLYGQIHMLDAD